MVDARTAADRVTAWVQYFEPANIRDVVKRMPPVGLTEKEARIGLQWAIDAGMVYLDKNMLLRTEYGSG